jgi:predicted DNA-binding protein
VAGLVRERNFDAALRVNDDTIERIEALAVRNAPELATVIREALGILAEQADAIEASKSSADAAHELELRNLSRAVTERSTSMSIDPSSQSTTMSQMQREMSGVF